LVTSTEEEFNQRINSGQLTHHTTRNMEQDMEVLNADDAGAAMEDVGTSNRVRVAWRRQSVLAVFCEEHG
jgi:hypothetical protein